jgi:hypothetical protein
MHPAFATLAIKNVIIKAVKSNPAHHGPTNPG